jgi:5-methylcytosine-specific restriction endonuclease McrA
VSSRTCIACGHVGPDEDFPAKKQWRLRRCRACNNARKRQTPSYQRGHGFFRSRLLFSTGVRRSQAGRPDFTAWDLAILWKRQRGRCALTGERLDRSNAHLDHVVPVRRGGTNSLSNVRWVTEAANRAKHTLLDSELLELCAQVIATHARSQHSLNIRP